MREYQTVTRDPRGGTPRPRLAARSPVPPGPLGDLKDLLFELYVQAQPMTFAEIATRIAGDDDLPGAPALDTVRRCITGPDVPPNQHDVVSVAVILARTARMSADEIESRVRQLWLAARLALPVGHAIRSWNDPYSLEVHPAINTVDNRLPKYVLRPFDAAISTVARRASQRRSALLAVVGGSSTGKTRACWEALPLLPDDWRLWHPIDPSPAEAFLADAARVGPRTVIWLNELQDYLSTTVAETGERVAATLRGLLRDQGRAPMLVVGTLWPEYWARLTFTPDLGNPDTHRQARMLLSGGAVHLPDRFSDGELQRIRRIAPHDSRLAEACVHAEDGKITQYLAGAPAVLERYRNAPPAARALLSAAVDLRRMGHGPALSGSVLEAAAAGYLTDDEWDAAGDGWFAEALSYTRAPCHGVRGPLSEIRLRPGQISHGGRRYRLSDYVEETGRPERATVSIPATTWQAALDHGLLGDLAAIGPQAERRRLDRFAFAFYRRLQENGDREAYRRAAGLLRNCGRHDEAFELYARAADAGEVPAARLAAGFLAETGQSDLAVERLRAWSKVSGDADLATAADLLATAGDPGSAVARHLRGPATPELVRQLDLEGHSAEVLDHLRRLWLIGDPDAAMQAAEFAGPLDDPETFLTCCTEFVEHRDWSVAEFACSRLMSDGRVGDALTLYCAAAATGHFDSAVKAAELLWADKQPGPAEEVLRSYLMSGGSGDPWDELTDYLAEADRVDTLKALSASADQHDESVDRLICGLLHEEGRTDEAIAWAHEHLDPRNDDSSALLGELLVDAGRVDEAIGWMRAQAEDGDAAAAWRYAGALVEAGRVEEAVTWLRDRAPGDPLADWQWVRLLHEIGRTAEAVAWVTGQIERGELPALKPAAEILADDGQIDAAVDLYRRAAQAGEPKCYDLAAELLHQAGRTDDAVAVYDAAAPSGAAQFQWQAAELLHEAGREDDALRHYQQAAEAGNDHALEYLVKVLFQAGRADEAMLLLDSLIESGNLEALRWRGELNEELDEPAAAATDFIRVIEAGGTVSIERLVSVLRRAGRAEEADRLIRYGLEPQARIGEPWPAGFPAP